MASFLTRMKTTTATNGNSKDATATDRTVTIVVNFDAWSLASSAMALIGSTAVVAGVHWLLSYTRKRLRSKWLEDEESKERQGGLALTASTEGEEGKNNNSTASGPAQSLPSIIEHFKELELNAQSTILEANRRRTTSYYEKAREAHERSLVLGIKSYSKLLQKRRNEVERMQFYYTQGTKSLRTVVVMCDPHTQQLLTEARQRILAPLQYSWDIYTKGVWIPALNVQPKYDMHVTVAIPWWWHTIRDGNEELSRALLKRLRHALIVDFHHPFCIELERIVLLGGKTLVALWRTVGERTVRDCDEEVILMDRHSRDIDPMVRLRREVAQCFTTEREEYKTKPLTHHHHRKLSMDGMAGTEMLQQSNKPEIPLPPPPLKCGSNQFQALSRCNSLPKTPSQASSSVVPPPPPPIPKPAALQSKDREHSIEMKTPGLKSGDGFIHTTLCRLPLDCLSTQDVELEPIHRLCREATATYAGHRMLVHKYRFLETTGKGGDSNPCTEPLFDETIVAPTKISVDTSGNVRPLSSLQASEMKTNLLSLFSSNNGGVGPSTISVEGQNALTTGKLEGLFLQQHQ